MDHMKDWPIIRVSKYYFRLVDRHRDDHLEPKHPEVKRMKAYLDKRNKQMNDFNNEIEKELKIQ
jgi:hypothetical protein